MRLRLFAATLLVAGTTLLAPAASAASTPLIDAIKSSDHTAARLLLRQRGAATVAEADGTTPLHWAVRLDDLEMVTALLKAGAVSTAANRYGSTPLELAAVNGNGTIVNALLAAGADAKAATAEGETVLMTAARSGSIEAMRALLVHGADPNAQERWFGETALIWAAAQNHTDAVRLLAEAGANIDTASTKMAYPRKVSGQTTLPVGAMTALMYAAREGALDAGRALVDLGASLDVQDADGTTAMVLAIINGHYDIAAMLVEKGANPNIADASGMAALYAAVDMNTLPFMHGRPWPKPSGRLGVEDVVKVLLAHKADPNQRLKTPLLRRHNNTSTQSLGEGTTPLMRAAASGDVALMRVLLDNGADPALRQKNGTTLLMLASGFGRRGDHNADAQEFERGTPEELLRAVKLCVELGLDVNTANDQGDTALHVAAGGDIIRFLAAQGAMLDAKNKRGHTPLALARARTDRSNRQLLPDAVAALQELAGNAVSPPPGDTTRPEASPASRTP